MHNPSSQSLVQARGSREYLLCFLADSRSFMKERDETRAMSRCLNPPSILHDACALTPSLP